MTKTAPNPFLLVTLLVIAFLVLIISLISASVSHSALSDMPFSSRQIRFNSEIIPGNVLYPFKVMADTIALMMMNTADQCLQRLQLATERLGQAGHLIELGDMKLALETMVKGQRYITEATSQCEQNKLSILYKESIKTTIDLYQKKLQEMKQYYPDTDRAVIDQLTAENAALLVRLQDR